MILFLVTGSNLIQVLIAYDRRSTDHFPTYDVHCLLTFTV